MLAVWLSNRKPSPLAAAAVASSCVSIQASPGSPTAPLLQPQPSPATAQTMAVVIPTPIGAIPGKTFDFSPTDETGPAASLYYWKNYKCLRDPAMADPNSEYVQTTVARLRAMREARTSRTPMPIN